MDCIHAQTAVSKVEKEHLAEGWVCECLDGNCKCRVSPNPVSRLQEADVLLSGGG